jgi:gp16 family phage-associated protein
MEYPQGFPEHLKPPVDQAIAEAEVEFCKAKLELPKRMSVPVDLNVAGSIRPDFEVGKAIIRYVQKVFFAFAKQAREAGKQQVWNGEKIRKELDEFLRHLIYVTYFEKDPAPTRGRYELCEQGLTELIRNSPEWIKHQQKMASIAKRISSEGRGPNPRKSATRSAGDLTGIRRTFVQPRLQEKGMSASKWADRAGFDTSVVYDYLNGKSKPRPETRKAMAEALGVTATEVPE